MGSIKARLEKIEDHVRCPMHRQRYACACQASALTPDQRARFDTIIDPLIEAAQLTARDLIPAPWPCLVCQRAQFCPGCQPAKLQWGTIRPQLSPEDAAWIEAVLS